MASSTSLGSRPPSSSQTILYSSRVSPSATACSTPGATTVPAISASGDGDTGHPLEELEAVGGAADQRLDRVLRMRHQPHDIALGVHHAGDVVLGAVEVV